MPMTYSQLPQAVLIELTNLAIGCGNTYPESDYTINHNEDGAPIRYTTVLLDNDWYDERVRFFEKTGDIIRIPKYTIAPLRIYNLWHIFALCRKMGLTYAVDDESTSVGAQPA